MRATLDKLISGTGAILALVLLAGAGLLFWASSFIGDQVDQQLSEQKITMPDTEAIDADEGLSSSDKKVMKQYAGSVMNTGDEAKAYADNYIKAHANHSTGGETYATLGAKQREACGENFENADSKECGEVSQMRDTAFKASTLRGLLLNAYAFGTMGTIAGYAAIGALVAGLLFAFLAILGFRHARRAERSARPSRSSKA